jgi:hypothetical protein
MSHRTALDIKYGEVCGIMKPLLKIGLFSFEVKTTAVSFMFVCPFPDVVE